MAKRMAISEFRTVEITFDDGMTAQDPFPIDAYKAAIAKVEEIESVYATTGSFTDLSGASVACTGANPNQVHVFTVDTTIATANYQFIYVETVPNHSQIS